MILPSANWRRTSCTTTPAVRPTARMARPENRNGTAPPINSPMNTWGSATLIWMVPKMPSDVSCRFSMTPTGSSSVADVSMKLANRATAAMTAEPMAKPLVTALVVLPTASRPTITRSASPSNSPDISAMPAALSATGPYVSSETTTPVVASMPMPVRATRYSVNCVSPPPSPMAAPSAMAMATMAHTDDSRPDDVPASTVVAGPVSAATAVSPAGGGSGGGEVSVDVKYSVMRLTTWASTRPITTAPNMRSPTLSITPPSGSPM